MKKTFSSFKSLTKCKGLKYLNSYKFLLKILLFFYYWKANIGFKGNKKKSWRW